ncbi:hypothetical protein CAJCM15448_24280 [Candidozyma auris]|nr:hypothetical protein CAJCM15448_24280 [[Candida] auris]
MDLPIQKYIGSAMRIKMVDDRVVDGVLTVVDPFGNLLLTNSYENSRDKIKTTSIKRREVGLVSIPRDRIVKVMVDERQRNCSFVGGFVATVGTEGHIRDYDVPCRVMRTVVLQACAEEVVSCAVKISKRADIDKAAD